MLFDFFLCMVPCIAGYRISYIYKANSVTRYAGLAGVGLW